MIARGVIPLFFLSEVIFPGESRELYITDRALAEHLRSELLRRNIGESNLGERASGDIPLLGVCLQHEERVWQVGSTVEVLGIEAAGQAQAGHDVQRGDRALVRAVERCFIGGFLHQRKFIEGRTQPYRDDFEVASVGLSEEVVALVAQLLGGGAPELATSPGTVSFPLAALIQKSGILPPVEAQGILESRSENARLRTLAELLTRRLQKKAPDTQPYSRAVIG